MSLALMPVVSTPLSSRTILIPLGMPSSKTSFANSDQSYFWRDDHTNALQQKFLGASIMVSDFIDEVGG